MREILIGIWLALRRWKNRMWVDGFRYLRLKRMEKEPEVKK